MTDDYWARYKGIVAFDSDRAVDVAVFTDPLVVEGVMDNGWYGDSDILIADLDLDRVFKALQGERIRVTIERLDRPIREDTAEEATA